MTGDYMLLLILCIPFAGALMTLLLRGGEKGAGESSDGKKKRDIWTGLITAAEMLIFASLFVIFLAGGRTGIAFDFQWEGFCGLGLHLCMDGFRALYCLVASLMWMMTSFFSMEYMGSYTSRNRYRFFTLLTLGATVGVFLSADLYTAFIFFEIMSFTSYTWVAHEETKEALRAAETYLAVAVIGGLVMLMGLFILYRELGTLEITALAEAVRSHTLAGESGAVRYRNLFIGASCLLFGFGAKAGVFPLHIWLPKAHPVAPAPASALLSGILTKAGIFGVLVVSCSLLQFDVRWGALILFLGVLTMFTGALLALFSVNLKRTLACSSVSQIGFILIGIGMQGLLGEEGSLAIRGSLLHMVNHSLIKLVLFMAAGVVFMNLHKLNLNEIRGFGRKKPLLNACFLMGALGIGGVPLWNGYTSKTLLHESIVEYRLLLASANAGVQAGGAHAAQAVAELSRAGIAGSPAAGSVLSFFTGSLWMGIVEWVFLISGGLTVAYMLKLYICLFLEKNADKDRQKEFEGMGRYMNGISSFALAGSAVLLPLLGLLPHLITDRLADMSSAFLNAQQPEAVVAYFSLVNLKGAGISLIIGILLYLTVVRKWMLCVREGQSVYVDRWPSWLDLEDRIYRPVLQKLLPLLFGSICRIADRLVDSLVVLLRKTIYRDSKIPHELKEGTALTHIVGSVLDGVTDYFNHPDATEEELAEEEYIRQHMDGKYEHKLAMVHDDLQENGTIIRRSLSFGLFLACFGLLLTLLYMLID